LAQEFIARYRQRFPKAISTFERGLDEALTFMRFPGSHQQLIRSTNALERLFREVKRRTKVVGVFLES
jgi:transposase-like protein